MRSLKKTLILVAALVLAACTLYNVPPAASPPKTKFVVEKSFDRVWTDLKTLAGLNSWRISGHDKASGSMTLRIHHDLKAVECFPDGEDVYFSGEMRVAAKALNKNRTQLRVKVRYFRFEDGREWSFSTGRSAAHRGPWIGLPTVGGLPTGVFPGEKRTCRPTHLTERTFIEAIHREIVHPTERDLRKSVATREEILGKKDTQVALALSRLADFYREEGRYSEAEATSLRAVTILENSQGSEHIDLVPGLNMLAAIYQHQQRYTESEAAYLRVLAIREKVSGRDHIGVAKVLNDLADVYLAQRRFDEVESIYKRVITIKERFPGAEHRVLAESLNVLARFYLAHSRYTEAESIYIRMLALRLSASGRQKIGEGLDQLVQHYDDQGRRAKAEELRNKSSELWSPYCYRPESNTMSIIGPKWAECTTGVFVTRSGYEEWRASKETYGEKFRSREAAEETHLVN